MADEPKPGSLRVTVEDIDAGTTDEAVLPPGEYLLICNQPAELALRQAFPNGTHVLTVKGAHRVPMVVQERFASIEGEPPP